VTHVVAPGPASAAYVAFVEAEMGNLGVMVFVEVGQGASCSAEWDAVNTVSVSGPAELVGLVFVAAAVVVG